MKRTEDPVFLKKTNSMFPKMFTFMAQNTREETFLTDLKFIW